MEPTERQIADLFSVVFNKDTTIEETERRTKGETAAESSELGAQSLIDGDYEQAIVHFKRAIEQRGTPNEFDNVNLAGALEVAEREAEALRQYNKALRINSEASEPRLGMSQLYKRHARYKDSIHLLEEAIQLEPHNPFNHFKLAEILRESGDKEAAVESARAAALAAPKDSFYHFWIGDLLIELRRFEEALDALRQAIDLSPGDDFLYLRAGVAFWGANRQQEAVKAVRLASDLDPDKNLYHGVVEMFLRHMGQDAEADLEQQRASKMDDYDREALRRIAEELDL